VLYSVLFLASGVALLAITYVLANHATSGSTLAPADKPSVNPDPSGLQHTVHLSPAQGQQLQAQAAHQHATEMHHLLVSSGIALAIATVLSVVLGWLIAGRVLRPLRTMTAATQRISDHNLHERLAIAGPDDELTRLGNTIDDLLARLERAFDAQRRFVANASHELRTPLTMMRTALDVATRKSVPPAPGVTMLAGKIRLGLDRADRLVEDFLTLARAQHDGISEAEAVALDGLVSGALAEHETNITAMALSVEQDENAAHARGSEALLSHLVHNLIDNAIRHNHPGGWIRVATRADTRAARLVVENSGPALDQHDVGDLVRPFRRVVPDRTNADATGFGIGLSIVAAIVTAHDGTLDLHALPDGGLRVTVTLPVAARLTVAAGARA
jgi:signal transduction histidine kinase